MQVIIEVLDGYYEILQETPYVRLSYEQSCIFKGKPLPQNLTNGDMIKTMLHITDEDCLYVHGTVKTISEAGYEMWFTQEWWNSPYERREDASID